MKENWIKINYFLWMTVMFMPMLGFALLAELLGMLVIRLVEHYFDMRKAYWKSHERKIT